MKRLFDILAVIIGFHILFPFLVLVGVIIAIDSRGGVFYLQERIGRNGKPFRLFKFRTMVVNAEQAGQLTVGARDSRITGFGYFLRRFKIDEFPQLINVLLGDMSIVGPRPEVKKYVDLYTKEQRKVLQVRPGLTDLASLTYINENELLEKAEKPEEYYIKVIMPEKLRLNMEYIDKANLSTDFQIIFKTIGKILS